MHRVIEGTWAEVTRRASTIKENSRVRLEILDEPATGTMITFGMFSGAGTLDDADFERAEWHDAQADLN